MPGLVCTGPHRVTTRVTLLAADVGLGTRPAGQLNADRVKLTLACISLSVRVCSLGGYAVCALAMSE